VLNDPKLCATTFAVDFTCVDCEPDVLRVVRREPDLVRRCSPCEAEFVRQTSDRLLTHVWGRSSRG
jgi:hypothetical protein